MMLDERKERLAELSRKLETFQNYLECKASTRALSSNQISENTLFITSAQIQFAILEELTCISEKLEEIRMEV